MIYLLGSAVAGIILGGVAAWFAPMDEGPKKF